MIWHILLAVVFTWLVLTLLVHAAMFVAVFIAPESHVSETLMRVGFVLAYPVFVPACKMRDASRKRKAIRMARSLARTILVSLPDDERDAFMVKLRSGENRKQTILEALHRVRELAEATK